MYNVAFYLILQCTNRTNQLRLHLAAIGHPILGDLFYSLLRLYKASNRLLHAEEMRFYHPRTRNAIKVLAPCPFRIEDYDRL